MRQRQLLRCRINEVHHLRHGHRSRLAPSRHSQRPQDARTARASSAPPTTHTHERVIHKGGLDFATRSNDCARRHLGRRRSQSGPPRPPKVAYDCNLRHDSIRLTDATTAYDCNRRHAAPRHQRHAVPWPYRAWHTMALTDRITRGGRQSAKISRAEISSASPLLWQHQASDNYRPNNQRRACRRQHTDTK